MSNMPKRTSVRVLPIAAVLLASTVLTACGGDPSGPTVAKGSAAPSAAGSSSPAGGFEQLLAYSRCMRSNGVPKFPDPKGSGNSAQISLSGTGVDRNSPQFKTAQKACSKYRVTGPPPNANGPVDPAKVGPWAACVRSHGVPNFPDPKVVGGNLELDFNGTGIDPGSPAYRNAAEACKSKSPGGTLLIKHGPSGKASGGS